MRGLIEFIARNLVDDPTAVGAYEIRNDRYATVIGLHVAADDLGKVIGRQGRVAKSMRSLMRASGALRGTHHIGLEIEDQGQERQDAPQQAPE
jgi:predicted RNA-binding protein YlqC (UPF0109 family)